MLWCWHAIDSFSEKSISETLDLHMFTNDINHGHDLESHIGNNGTVVLQDLT